MATVLDRLPSDKELVEISKYIGNNWECLAAVLNIPLTQVEHIIRDNPQSTQTQIYHMLLHWRKQEFENGTLSLLFCKMHMVNEVTIDWGKIEKIYGPSVNSDLNSLLLKRMSDTPTADETIRFFLKAYFPEICNCVKVRDLLDHLAIYFTDEEAEDLSAANNIDATRKALQILLKNKEPGVFKALRDALERSEYPKIVQLLDGNEENLQQDVAYQHIIKVFTDELVRQLNPTDIVPHLFSNGVLGQEDKETIDAAEHNYGRTHASRVLLLFLRRRKEDWFKYFLISLVECSYNDISKKLDPDLTEKIIAQNNYAMSANQNNSDTIDDVQKTVLMTASGSGDCDNLNDANISCKLESLGNGTKAKECLCSEEKTENIQLDVQNDLSAGISGGSSFNIPPPLSNTDFVEENTDAKESVEKEIATDKDAVTSIQDVDVDLRNYQKELATDGLAGENVIIAAPTNSGKTHVACRIIQEHLRHRQRNGKVAKVVFLVENEALAFQQASVCSDLLPAYRSKVFTGNIQRDKKQMLKDYLNRRDIFIVTAQLLLNFLNDNGDLSQFSLLVFDECHHTTEKHSYNEIMSKYMDLKLKECLDASKLPQVVGLTASLGVNGYTDRLKATNHMKQVLANMDAKFLRTVRDTANIQEMAEIMNNSVGKIIKAAKRKTDKFRKAVTNVVTRIDRYMMTHPSMSCLSDDDKFIHTIVMEASIPDSIHQLKFIQWLRFFQEGICKVSSKNVVRLLNPCRRHLEIYNQALLIHADARITDAKSVIENFMAKFKGQELNETDNFLLQLYSELQKQSFDDEDINPKLVHIQSLVQEATKCDDNARIIIFVKTRALAKVLVNWMHETPNLANLNAKEFVGQTAARDDGGSTKSIQRDILRDFESGKHKVLIATSILEEGLDIPKCNLVIRYEYVTNEIVRLQSKGRARAKGSSYIVVTEEDSQVVEKERKNADLEKLMNELIPELIQYIEKNENMWEGELQTLQIEAKKARESERLKREERMVAGIVELMCDNCSAFICSSDNMRVVAANNRIIIDEFIKERVNFKRKPLPKFANDIYKMDGDITCKECGNRLGGVFEYKHVEFPLISPKKNAVRIKYNTQKSKALTAWKKADFNIQELTLDELSEIIVKVAQQNLLCDEI